MDGGGDWKEYASTSTLARGAAGDAHFPAEYVRFPVGDEDYIPGILVELPYGLQASAKDSGWVLVDRVPVPRQILHGVRDCARRVRDYDLPNVPLRYYEVVLDA